MSSPSLEMTNTNYDYYDYQNQTWIKMGPNKSFLSMKG